MIEQIEHITAISEKNPQCIGCRHFEGRFFGKCIHCSRNPNQKDCYEIEAIIFDEGF